MSRSRLKALIKKAAKSRKVRVATPALPKGPNATERMFNLRFLGGKGKFEPISFDITNLGSKYTPDLGLKIKKYGLEIEMYVEVKGEYRSKKDEKLITERSRLAWEIAAEKYPWFVWVWAKKHGTAFECKVVAPYITDRMVKATVRTAEEFDDLIFNELYAPEARDSE